MPQLINSPKILQMYPSETYPNKTILTESSNPPCRIETSHLDGSDRAVLVDAFLGMPNGLTIDFEEGLLCWTDGGAAVSRYRP